MIGRTISHYRIVGQLGVGGMGIVYRAEDDRLGRSVALKFLPEDLATDRQAVERLHAEARAASALNHASICAIYDIGTDQGRPYIVMELLKGQTLRDRLASGGLKLHQIVDIGIQIADALDAAHTQGIIHRDIKPANIFLTDRGQVKLLDFGVAKLTQDFAHFGTTATPDLTAEGVTLGTISYMSPEQATGEPLDGRTDLFSLGVVLYECATGRQPFLGKTSAVILSNILNRAPVAPVILNPELPAHLQEVINNCLEKDRELRYQSAAGLRADLKRLRRDLESGQSRAIDVASAVEASRQARASASRLTASAPSLDRGQSSPTQPGESSRKNWLPVAAALSLAIAAGVGYTYWRRTPPAAQATPPAQALSDADVQSRIDQAAAEMAAKLTEDALQRAQQAIGSAASGPAGRPSEPAKPSPSPRVEGAKPEPPRNVAPTSVPLSAPTTIPAAAPIAPPVPPAPTSVPGEPPAAVQRAPAPQAAPPPVAAPPPSAPAPAPATAATTPATVPAAPPEPRRDPTALSDDDEAAIRRIVDTYARAIENKSIDLFRSVKPNLSAEERRRLEEGFRAVSKQSVNVTILSIERRGAESVVVLRRRDTIQAGGRQQSTESQQTLTMSRSAAGWIITAIR